MVQGEGINTILTLNLNDNEWLINQQRHQAMVQQFLREYYK